MVAEELRGGVAEFFDGHPGSLDCYLAVAAVLDDIGPYAVRVTRSQVAFRRRRAFAWVWTPGRWIAHPRTETVLSFALTEPMSSPRLAEAVHPAPAVWMHHLDLSGPEDVDAEVRGWLERAYAEAA